MKVRKRIIAIASIVIISLSVVIFVTTPTKSALIFYEKNSENISAYLPLKVGQSFQIIFTHSIHLTDVVEKYEIMEDYTIKQYEIIFEEFGIGMPSNAEGTERFVYEDGKYHIKNMNNFFPFLNIRNGKTVSEHRLIWQDENGKEHKAYFNDYFEPGDWFTVKYEKLSLVERWKEVKIHE